MPQIPRILVPLDPHDPNTWIEALSYGLDLCDPGETDAHRIILAVPSRAQMKSMTIAGHLGAMFTKALAEGLTPVVFVNKIDRPNAEPKRVHDRVLDALDDVLGRPR